MTTIVLGWDGLDYDWIQEYELADCFGQHTKKISTVSNPHLGNPHTREVWPSIITGLRPQEHGIRILGENRERQWENRVLNRGSRIASRFLPSAIRSQIGKALSTAGAGIQRHGPEYYASNGIETVFDGRFSLAGGIVNYRTELDERLDIWTERKPLFDRHLEDTDGGLRPKDEDSILNLEQEQIGECSKKIGLANWARLMEYDLAFVWLGLIDTAGHLDELTEGRFQQRAYQIAAEFTSNLRERSASGDEVICISDHGIRDGKHTESAVLAAADDYWVREIDSVLDFKNAADRRIPSSENRDSVSRIAPNAAVRQQLVDLQYIDD